MPLSRQQVRVDQAGHEDAVRPRLRAAAFDPREPVTGSASSGICRTRPRPSSEVSSAGGAQGTSDGKPCCIDWGKILLGEAPLV